MAKPIELEQGLNYFPLDVHLDDKYKLVEAEHGVLGFGVIVKLLQKIYGKGYYCEWNKSSQLIFSKECGIELEKINSIIKSALEWELFDKKLFEEHNILTSPLILKQFIEIAKRRKSVVIIKEYTAFGDQNVDVNIYAENVDIFSINDNILEQRKENKRREKNRKRKNYINTNNYIIQTCN